MQFFLSYSVIYYQNKREFRFFWLDYMEDWSIKFAKSIEEFEPVRLLGCGDMGNVFLVKHLESENPVAMKMIDKQVVEIKKSFKRVQTEREILSKLDHPFLPKLIAKFESTNHYYLLMGYCPGGDLSVLRHNQEDQRFSESAARY